MMGKEVSNSSATPMIEMEKAKMCSAAPAAKTFFLFSLQSSIL